MGNLSKNLSRYEISCHCGCGYDTIDVSTVAILQDCCDHFAEKLDQEKVVCIVHSGTRCLSWNLAIGSTDESQHVIARAIDFHIKGVTPADTFAYLEEKHPEKLGLGLYNTFVHLDTRNRCARWVNAG